MNERRKRIENSKTKKSAVVSYAEHGDLDRFIKDSAKEIVEKYHGRK